MPQLPEELVELLPAAEPFLAQEAAVVAPSGRRGLVLVHDLAGDFDAAHAGALAGAHLLASLPAEVIARFVKNPDGCAGCPGRAPSSGTRLRG